MARLPWTAKGFAVKSCPVFNEASVQPRRAASVFCDPVETCSPPLLLEFFNCSRRQHVYRTSWMGKSKCGLQFLLQIRSLHPGYCVTFREAVCRMHIAV